MFEYRGRKRNLRLGVSLNSRMFISKELRKEKLKYNACLQT